MGDKAEEATLTPGDLIVDEEEFAARAEAVAVQEWYIREKILFEQKALDALESFKKTGQLGTLFPLPGKKGKSKTNKDGSEKAKRTISAYNLYIRYQIEEMKANGQIPPNSKITDTIKELGAAWTKMDPGAKAITSKGLFERHAKENPDFVIPPGYTNMSDHEEEEDEDEEPAPKKKVKRKP
eukprot:CAMPEP_0117652778 /NCGR_PEP_ID=MMETSP0804-20121206/2819_1 /TAXON_ID=1074897 /ORGANISM="Tetraselmis astigmatica, Strain CCMP880" /LENGTH=181 /DNA_ID=CAMNT_0005458869 /DNA_START=289 /DNA_END=834 /DNA_ORIENTATION=+